MSFGKRNAKKEAVTRVARRKPLSTASKLGLITGILVFAGLLSAGMYHWRFQVLAFAYPKALIWLYTPSTQIGGDWIETAVANPQISEKLIVWMRTKMAALCGDKERVVPWAEAPAATADDDTTENIGALPSLYKDAAISAQQMLDRLAVRKQQFCEHEYYVARFDSRWATLVYSQQRFRRDWDKSWQEFEVKKAKLEREIAASSRHSAPAYSSDNIDIRERCRRVHPDNYEYREICERNQEEARLAIRGMDVPDEIARHCDRVHDDNYEYRRICYRNQMEAKDRRGY